MAEQHPTQKLYLELGNVWTRLLVKAPLVRDVYSLLRVRYPNYQYIPRCKTCENWIARNNKPTVGENGRCRYGFPCDRGMDRHRCPRFRPQWDGYANFVSIRYGTNQPRMGKPLKYIEWAGFPTGLLHIVQEWADKRHLPVIIYDMREKPKPVYPPYKWTGPALYPHQEQAVKKFLIATRGIIRAPTGSGKTEIAAAIIARLSAKTIYLVDSLPLLKQTFDRLRSSIRCNVGIIGGGEWDEAEVTVATVQSIYNNMQAAKPLLKKVSMMVLDECVPADTQVMMRNGVEKRIDFVRPGDEVLSYNFLEDRFEPKKVLRVWRRKRNYKLYRFTFNGLGKTKRTLVCSERHRIYEVIHNGTSSPIPSVRLRPAGKMPKSGIVLRLQPRQLAKLENGQYVPVPFNYYNYDLVPAQISDKESFPSGQIVLYDIEVEDNHNFFANGFLISNCHHSSSPSWYSIAKSCNAYWRLGLSATPISGNQLDDMRVMAVTGRVVESIDEEQMIEEGYIATPRFKVYRFKEEPTECRNFAEEYRRYVTLNSKYNCLIADIVEPFIIAKKKVLILLEHVRHLEVLSKFIPDAHTTWGDDPNIDEQLQWFKTTDSGVLICTPVLSEGVDLPTVDVIVLAGQGKKWTRTIQQLGRGMRRGRDNRLLVIDIIMEGLKYLTKHGKERLATYHRVYPNQPIEFVDETPKVWDNLPETTLHWHLADELADFYNVLPEDIDAVECAKTYETCVSELLKERRVLFNWNDISSDKYFETFRKLAELCKQMGIKPFNYIAAQFDDVSWVKNIDKRFRYPIPPMLLSRACQNRARTFVPSKTSADDAKLLGSWHIVKTIMDRRGLNLHEAVKMSINLLHPRWVAGYMMQYPKEAEQLDVKFKERADRSIIGLNSKSRKYLLEKWVELNKLE